MRVVGLSDGGRPLRVMVGIMLIRRDRAVGFLVTSELGSPFPESECAALAQKMSDPIVA